MIKECTTSRIIINIENTLEMLQKKSVEKPLLPHIRETFDFQIIRLRHEGMTRLADVYEKHYAELTKKYSSLDDLCHKVAKCQHTPRRVYYWSEEGFYGASCKECGTDYVITKESYDDYQRKQYEQAL